MDHFPVSEDGLKESSVHPTTVASAASGPCRTVLQLSWQATIGSVNILRSTSLARLRRPGEASGHVTRDSVCFMSALLFLSGSAPPEWALQNVPLRKYFFSLASC